MWPDGLSPAWGRGTYAGMNVAVVCDLDGDGLGEIALSTPREPACGMKEPGLGEAGQKERFRFCRLNSYFIMLLDGCSVLKCR